MITEIASVESALRATFEGLDAAGYSLELAMDESCLDMTILARDGACEECLVPKTLFLQLVRDELQEVGIQFGKITIRYPKDQR